MIASPATNFDQARSAVMGGAGMQSSFVAVPGGGASTAAPSMNFPDPAMGPLVAPPPEINPQAAQSGSAPIPDVSMQAGIPTGSSPALDQIYTLPPTTPPAFDANTTPFSSATTPLPPPSGPAVAVSPPPAPIKPKVFHKKWSLSRKITVTFIVVLAAIALVIFVYSFFNRHASPSSTRPDVAPQPKDIVVHLAQGSALELQGLKDLVPQSSGGDVSGLKRDIASMQKTLDSIDTNQKTIEETLNSWDDWQPSDGGDSKKKASKPRDTAPTAAPTTAAPASRLSKAVHYSADLAMQSGGGSEHAEVHRSNAKWATGAPTRFYGGASAPHDSPMHFSEFSISMPRTEQV